MLDDILKDQLGLFVAMLILKVTGIVNIERVWPNSQYIFLQILIIAFSISNNTGVKCSANVKL